MTSFSELARDGVAARPHGATARSASRAATSASSSRRRAGRSSSRPTTSAPCPSRSARSCRRGAAASRSAPTASAAATRGRRCAATSRSTRRRSSRRRSWAWLNRPIDGQRVPGHEPRHGVAPRRAPGRSVPRRGRRQRGFRLRRVQRCDPDGLPLWSALIVANVAGVAFNFMTMGGYVFWKSRLAPLPEVRGLLLVRLCRQPLSDGTAFDLGPGKIVAQAILTYPWLCSRTLSEAIRLRGRSSQFATRRGLEPMPATARIALQPESMASWRARRIRAGLRRRPSLSGSRHGRPRGNPVNGRRERQRPAPTPQRPPLRPHRRMHRTISLFAITATSLPRSATSTAL